jgi:hypothetical protein
MTTRATTPPGRPARPWYREPWPWFLIAGPAIVVVAGVTTAFIAASTDDGLVADDYYKRGLLINKELERSGRGTAMKLGAVAVFGPDGVVRVDVTGFATPAEAPPTLLLKLAHATRAGYDRTVALQRGADGAYLGTLDALPPGRWRVTVEADAWRLPSVEVGGTLYEVRLGAARRADQ